MTLQAIYTNFKLENPVLTLEIIIWGVFAGLVIGSFISYYNKIIVGYIPRMIIKNEAIDKENALTFDEMGIKKSRFFRRLLKDGSVLRKHVFIANPSECEIIKPVPKIFRKIYKFYTGRENKPVEYDLDKAKFYIEDEKKYAASFRYEKKGLELLKMFIFIIVLLVFAIALHFAIPTLLSLIDDVISMFKNIGVKE